MTKRTLPSQPVLIAPDRHVSDDSSVDEYETRDHPAKRQHLEGHSKLAYLATAATIIPDDGEEELKYLSRLAILKRVALHHSLAPIKASVSTHVGRPLPPPPRLPKCLGKSRLAPISTTLLQTSEVHKKTNPS